MNSGEHAHKDTKGSEIWPLSYMSQRLREMQKTTRVLSRPGSEFSAQRPHGAEKRAEKGGLWMVCAGDHINAVKNPQIL